MLGHILQMKDQQKELKMKCLASKNTNRRPSTSFLTTIKKDLKSHKLTLNEAFKLAQNRKCWKLEGSLLQAHE